VRSPTARNLVRVFFMQERLKSLGKGGTFQAKRVHVVGAGVMGGDIAAWCAQRGLTVTLQDQGMERIAPALQRAYAAWGKRIRDARELRNVMDRLIPDPDGHGARQADVVIEAIFEKP
jgi:3-hydroxyacyl-CoA dehydrogenase/enoyl-CoA hydratase/3-hydroxybutyryl-CoA epimerase